MATNGNVLILSECTENPPMVMPILDATEHAQSTAEDTNNNNPKRNYVQRQSFFVGGTYVGPSSARVMQGQMYVEALLPSTITHPLPLILIHGGAQTGMNWATTPDGRPGWAEWLANRGWKVYIIDQPTCGRSAWQPDHDTPLAAVSALLVERFWTAPKEHKSFAPAEFHTQWPGTGKMGDPVFDQYFASVMPRIDPPGSEPLMRDAGAALLDRIGPAILIAHSQGGQLSWLIGDARPDLVKGIIALEPSGPPYRDVVVPDGRPKKYRFYGLTTEPLRYEPEVTQSSPLEFEKEPETGYWAPQGPPRRLVHLAKIPIVLITAQASYHVVYDHLTVRYLEEAGVGVKHVRLEDHGILGNGHMMMLEKNSDEIVAFVETLLVSII